jgi:uncharacterized membrane protein YhaH (DUF805 family)
MFRAYQRYFDFRGRAGRKEYWLFILLVIIIDIAAIGLDVALFGSRADAGFNPVYWIASLANCIPSLAVGFRRLHDINRSAWWLLIAVIPIVGAIVLLVFFCTKGDPGENRFGPPDAGDPAPEPAGTVA